MRDTIPAAFHGERIDRVVSFMTERSRSNVKQLIVAGSVSVNGEIVTSASHRVIEGDEIDAQIPVADPLENIPMAVADIAVDVVYEDDHVVVIDKPVGLVVHPGAGHTDDTLVNGLLALYPDSANVGQVERPGVVHRLDRDTSGLLVWARTEEAYEGLTAQLAERSMKRVYLTIVGSIPDSERGMVDAPIGRSRRTRTRMAVVEGGREARTTFETVEVWHLPFEASLLRCGLETGRTHQIRVHLAAIGLPVLGDATYGRPDPFGIGRTLLHAQALSFEHPITGEKLAFESEPPADFQAALEGFRTAT
ncbi:MAG: 23S rRNA pseudouridine1911/1915/1917 synthase [Candidatus Poriferisodalaceae bacterium]|jgi:23S rRNA pseudouridine1911/1915/1917 synthase